MPELYKILDPKDVPPPNKMSLIRSAIKAMNVGDTIAIPRSQRTIPSTIAMELRYRLKTRVVDDLCYVQRLPDNAS